VGCLEGFHFGGQRNHLGILARPERRLHQRKKRNGGEKASHTLCRQNDKQKAKTLQKMGGPSEKKKPQQKQDEDQKKELAGKKWAVLMRQPSSLRTGKRDQLTGTDIRRPRKQKAYERNGGQCQEKANFSDTCKSKTARNHWK